MTLSEFLDKLSQLEASAPAQIAAADSADALAAVRNALVGRQAGALTAIMNDDDAVGTGGERLDGGVRLAGGHGRPPQ